jgi:hypothetical protein
MARTFIPVVSVNRFALTSDATPLAMDVTHGNFCINDGATALRFASTSGAVQTVTVTLPAGADVNLVVGPRVITIPANLVNGVTGFFPVNIYGSQLQFTTSNSLVTVLAESYAG